MERRYIWFHTGYAFVIGSVGAVIATLVSLWILSALGSSWQTFVLILIVTGVAVTPAFVVDRPTDKSEVDGQIRTRLRTTDFTDDTDRI